MKMQTAFIKPIIFTLFWGIACLMPFAVLANPRSIYVAKSGNDKNSGNASSPVLTITKAESIALPGDRIIIYKGTYREMVIFHKGGSPGAAISYSASPGEEVIIKGSERVRTWVKAHGRTWRATINDDFFNGTNPFKEWINRDSSYRHLGEVYLDNKLLNEQKMKGDVERVIYSWFTSQENGKTIITANFGANDPNQKLTEINVRPSAFAAEKPGISFIVIDGLKIAQIASAPAFVNGVQPGAINANGGTHWVIKNCSLSYCKSVAISIGQTGHDYPGSSPGNPEYRDLSQDISTVGHDTITHNHISYCGQAGIFGLLHGTQSIIADNLIEDINSNNDFPGNEIAGIRLALAVDVLISHNLIRRVHGTGYGIYLGPLFQGARISRNVITETSQSAIYLYNSHGPALFDNNIISGPGKSTGEGVKMISAEGNVFVQNLFYDCAFINQKVPGRTFATSNFLPHSLVIKQTIPALAMDDRWYSNVFVKSGLDKLNNDPDCLADYNAYIQGALPTAWGDKQSHTIAANAGFALINTANSAKLMLDLKAIPKVTCPVLSPEYIGFFALSKQYLEYSNGKAITINEDFKHKPKDALSGFPGPFYQYWATSDNNQTLLFAY
ncbi:parallel beta-helix repeat (two copies) [Mucilaginibacter mallensis]|uniref:Parallel beta-helix repeat (Two copies) n=1 Tax=Mucilaginibacter mallensis TaxID=652787 RepID=A0A1H1ZQY8_MUCMA|nr:right-handed parallel beta-helix repeat-containing protein [Mucilaginibacter mallensis]SDT36241.1 parallel beta-helix repeat (two copies) [Mucilaginibacter mallensis]